MNQKNIISKLLEYIFQEAKAEGVTNMRALSWDDRLAEVAQKWTDQCINGHEHESSDR